MTIWRRESVTPSKNGSSITAKNVELDEYLNKGDGTFLKDAAEFQNERIEGSKAAVETRDPAKVAWVKIPLVEEDGAWKVAFDKLLEDADASVVDRNL